LKKGKRAACDKRAEKLYGPTKRKSPKHATRIVVPRGVLDPALGR
jgi:hypothetical protein